MGRRALRCAAVALSAVMALASGASADALRRADDGFAGRVLGVGRTSSLVLSPFSISETLAMLDPAAHGRTAAELARTLGFTASAPSVTRGFRALNASLDGANRSGVTVSVANSLWGEQSYPFRSAFRSVLASDFGAPLQRVDFARAPATAVNTINNWVAFRTAGKITKLLGSADVDASTRLVLVNAIYLGARWASPFSRSSTSIDTFHAAGGDEQVPTMHQESGFPYARGRGYAVAELPYLGGRLAFDVVLPDAGRTGLSSVLTRVRRSGPSSLLTGLHPAALSLSLPKLLLRTHVELATPLRALGLARVFEPGVADLSGAGGRRGDLFLSTVVHEAYLKVDEAGTEAAAATGAGISSTAVLETTPFDVDRPFVFLLRDRRSGAMLFEGVVRRV